MKVAICVIGRLENRYAIEFVEYYKNLGIDHIYIGDNNYDGEEYFEDALQRYIDENFITIISYRNIINCQESYYENTYKDYRTLYDYMIFIDFDEFITLVKDSNIKEYLKRNTNYNVIKLNWMIYTDNNLIYDDSRPCLERFTEPMELYRHVTGGYPENHTIKCIVKCEFDSIVFKDNPHMIDLSYNKEINNYKVCNSSFIDTQFVEDCCYEFNKDGTIEYSLAYIKHFMFKTIDEYVHNKLRRGTIEGGVDDMLQRYKFRFFKVNEKTPEKIQYCIDHNIDSDIL